VKRLLVIDIGGNSVKLMIARRERRKFPSGRGMTPRQFIAGVRQNIEGWKMDTISIGFPAPVRDGRILAEPKNLGGGWKRFDFRKTLGKPVRIVNDAAMQALGSYRGGRMLFLGLGTGVGSALLWSNHVLSLELGDLPYVEGKNLEDHFGDAGLEKLGQRRWAEEIVPVIERLRIAMIADYVVLGGGNAKLIESLPKPIELGHNRNAFTGGARLWETNARTRRPKWVFV
jgi:polyphosphate glucokinase